MTRVFVYGTLKRKQSNHRLLANSRLIGEAYTVECYKMFTVGFPVLMKTEAGGHSVLGEIYEVDDLTLKQLDRLEANGSMYEREQVSVQFVDYGAVYLHQDEHARDDQAIIENGVWMYIGKTEYWSKHPNIPAYVELNKTGELEWHE